MLIGCAAGMLVLAGGTANAHVRVSAPRAVVGAPATLDFRMPSEEQVATTIRLAVTIPSDVTVTGAPTVPDWTVVLGRHGADTTVTWTTTGSGLAPDTAVDLLVTTAALPDRPSIGFAALQTYANGDLVSWDQPQTGPNPPPHPAPSLRLAGFTPGAKPEMSSTTGTPSASAGGPGTGQPSVSAQPRSTSSAGGLVPGLVVGTGLAALAALAASVLVRRRKRGRAPAAS